MAYKTPESIVSKEIYDYLLKRKIFQKRNHASASSYGLPDREFLYKGICVGIEIKQANGKVKEHQQRKLDLYNNNGGIGIAVRSVEEVKLLIQVIDEEENLGDGVFLSFIAEPIRYRYERLKNEDGSLNV